MREIIGRRIDAIWIDDDEQSWLRFDTDAGSFLYYAEGDCCSESWFYHLIGVNALLGHVVGEVREVDMGEPADGYSRQESDKLYGVNLTTSGGRADIEFRNSSNGYYGGWLSFVQEGSVPSEVRMIQVTGDYIAQIGTVN